MAINVNYADSAELRKLKGIAEHRANLIIRIRDEKLENNQGVLVEDDLLQVAELAAIIQ